MKLVSLKEAVESGNRFRFAGKGEPGKWRGPGAKTEDGVNVVNAVAIEWEVEITPRTIFQVEYENYQSTYHSNEGLAILNANIYGGRVATFIEKLS